MKHTAEDICAIGNDLHNAVPGFCPALPLPIVYLFVNGVDLLKCIIGFILVKKGVWVNNIVASSQDVPQAD